MHGYFAGLNSSGVILGKQQNNWTVLDFTPMTVKVGEWHHMKVIANGTNIQVYVNDMNNPRISISDSTF